VQLRQLREAFSKTHRRIWGPKAKKPEPQQVQQITNATREFPCAAKQQQVPPVTFNQNHRIEGSDPLAGSAYEVFARIIRQRHDERSGIAHYSPRGVDRWRLLLLEQRLLYPHGYSLRPIPAFIVPFPDDTSEILRIADPAVIASFNPMVLIECNRRNLLRLWLRTEIRVLRFDLLHLLRFRLLRLAPIFACAFC